MGDYCRDIETQYKRRLNIWQNKDSGWTMSSLCKELGVEPKTIRRAARRCGLVIHTKPRQVLTDEDIETIIVLYRKRRAERLYGS